MTDNKKWEEIIKNFDDEFGIHFKNAPDELKFAHAFLEEVRELGRKEGTQEIGIEELGVIADMVYGSYFQGRSEIIREIEEWINNPKNFSVGQSGDFREDLIVVEIERLSEVLARLKEQETK